MIRCEAVASKSPAPSRERALLCDVLTTAGWHPYSSVASFIAAIGGYGDLARAEQNAVRDAIRAYMGPGNTFNAPTATFEDTLLATIRRRHRGVTELPDRSDAISTELDGIKAKYTTNDRSPAGGRHLGA
ncbi:MAG: hypothetical protein IV100_32600 [Myxococcales bacterium]|nr:hypothetical protein [Myxococcales bacterium]